LLEQSALGLDVLVDHILHLQLESTPSQPLPFGLLVGVLVQRPSKFSSVAPHRFCGQVSAAQNRLRLNMRSQSHSNHPRALFGERGICRRALSVTAYDEVAAPLRHKNGGCRGSREAPVLSGLPKYFRVNVIEIVRKCDRVNWPPHRRMWPSLSARRSSVDPPQPRRCFSNRGSNSARVLSTI
jgi:hypothetical protein